MKKINLVISAGLLFIGVVFSSRLAQTILFPIIEKIIGHYPGTRIEGIVRLSGLLLIFSSVLVLIIYFSEKSRWKNLQNMVNKLIKKIRNWFVIRLDRWIEFGEVRKKLLKFNYMDIFLIFVFICFACLFTLAQLQINFPMVRLSSDGSIVMSYAAAEKYPSHFSTDPYLSNPKNFATYSSILLPLVKWLEPLVGNFSLAEMVILFPVVLLYLIGFYFLGKAYFNNRAWALFFTFLNSIPLIIPLEVYGLFYEPLPRFIFTALLPYVLLMVWQFKG